MDVIGSPPCWDALPWMASWIGIGRSGALLLLLLVAGGGFDAICLLARRRLSLGDFLFVAFQFIVCGVPSRLLMALESRLWPELDDFPPNASEVVFILGHYRSATTSVHSSMLSLPRGRRFHSAVAGCYGDNMFPSYLMKCWLLRFFCQPAVCNTVQALVGSDKAAGGVHDISANALLEETLFINWKMCGDVLHFFVLPSLGRSYDGESGSKIRVSEEEIRFMRRCVTRVAWFKRHGAVDDRETLYVGCPLGLSSCPQLLAKVFPEAKFIVCAREPAKSVRSSIELLKHVSFPGRDWRDPAFKQFVRTFYRHNTRPIYRNLANFLDRHRSPESDDGKVIVVDFGSWCANGPKEIRRIWEWLGLELNRDFTEEDCRAAVKRSSNHKNSPRSLELASALNLEDDTELWKDYARIMVHAST
ncbi:hypothetical protein ACHAWF_014092 [Thalassiosira exigua]